MGGKMSGKMRCPVWPSASVFECGGALITSHPQVPSDPEAARTVLMKSL